MFPNLPATLSPQSIPPATLAEGTGFGLLSPWALGAMLLSFVLWRAARRAATARIGRLGAAASPTLRSRLQQPLPDAILVIAAAGEAAAAHQSGDAAVLRTTPGLRLVAVVVGAAILWLLYGPQAGAFLPLGWPSAAAAGVVALSLGSTFGFEARADRDRLVVEYMGHFRREFRWAALTAIRDDGGYLWRLDFAPGGSVRVPKHLVGARGFLSLVREVLDRNAARNARTA
ncbi:MAG: hypothetical protein KF887_00140 [Paracoccaceae bacterium]|nr:MAG: hypothetical protein KF887_00140 [Paracoccaceae bacterium]